MGNRALITTCLVTSISLVCLGIFIYGYQYTNLFHRDNIKPSESECLGNLTDFMSNEKLQSSVRDNRLLEFISLIDNHLPNCKVNLPSRFFAELFQSLKVEIEKLNKQENILNFDSPWINQTFGNEFNDTDICPLVSPLMVGKHDIDISNHGEVFDNGKYWNWPPTFEEIALEYYTYVDRGGYYPGPPDCKCRGTTAIIIPYRAREEHLRFFLHYTHKILQNQQLCYIIIVAEQVDNNTFNKGQLMNTGYVYAKSLPINVDCYVFHDVDIISEDDRAIYTCRKGNEVVHIAPYIDKYKYKHCCGVTVGAAIGFNREQFEDLNGFSNLYTGWGGEDDDMHYRILHKGYNIWRSPRNYTRFKMVKHGKDVQNTLNEFRFTLLDKAIERQDMDGVNSLHTTMVPEKSISHTRLKIWTV